MNSESVLKVLISSLKDCKVSTNSGASSDAPNTMNMYEEICICAMFWKKKKFMYFLVLYRQRKEVDFIGDSTIYILNLFYHVTIYGIGFSTGMWKKTRFIRRKFLPNYWKFLWFLSLFSQHEERKKSTIENVIALWIVLEIFFFLCILATRKTGYGKILFTVKIYSFLKKETMQCCENKLILHYLIVDPL